MVAPVLPPEVWNHVFRYLSAADKFSVRVCCKYFKKLIDHKSLWKDYTVVLGFRSGSYNSHFWVTLRRREVTCVVMRSGRAQDWKQLSAFLPALTTVIIDKSSKVCLDYLKYFTNLKHLAIRKGHTSVLPDASLVCRPQQLTRLSMCDVKPPTATLGSFISAVSQYAGLTSLVWHHMGIFEETFLMLRSILTRMPKLKHLSLSCVRVWSTHPGPDLDPFEGEHGPNGASSLSSLELIDYPDASLPEHAMRLMPGLKSLAIFYRNSHQKMSEGWPSPECHLNTWLSDLPQLSTLVIVKGPPIETYVASIPTDVTSLTLCDHGLSSKDMAAVSTQVPNLLQLHIDPWPSHLGALTAQIPPLFPKLRRLKLRHEHVPERDFLALQQLQDLEFLEILDSHPRLSVLTGKLQAVTNKRFQISLRQRDVFSCQCRYLV